MVKINYDEIQAWDEYQALNKKHCEYLETINRAKEELNKVLVWELIEFEKNVAPLMPYIKDKILEELEIRSGKYGEERRELQSLEKETND